VKSKQAMIRCSKKVYEESKKRQKNDVKELSLFHYAAIVYVESLEFNSSMKKTVKPKEVKNYVFDNPFKIA